MLIIPLSDSSLVLKSKYAKERDIEFSARALSRLEDCDESTEWKGKRFACYDASTYADPKLNTQIGVHIAIEKEYQGMKNEEIGGENKRKWFINSRINETGPTHYGFRYSTVQYSAVHGCMCVIM